MKKKTRYSMTPLAALALAFSFALGLPMLHSDEKGDKHEEHEGHDHDHDHVMAGPNGGRVLHSVDPHLEFFVTEDRKVQIAALDADGKAVPIAEQSVRVTGGDRSNPTRMTFAKEGDVLISDVAFPEGNDFPVVVQIKSTPDAKSAMEKFNLNLIKCPTCPYKEYACTCCHDHDHDHEGHEGDHKETEGE